MNPLASTGLHIGFVYTIVSRDGKAVIKDRHFFRRSWCNIQPQLNSDVCIEQVLLIVF